MLQSILIILFFLPRFIESSGNWSYDNIQTWKDHDHYCGGLSQSPIDLQFNQAKYRRLRAIYFDEQQTPNSDSFHLTNNGHTAQLSLKNHYVLKHVSADKEDYKVEQLHFHWSHSNDSGSEHLLEGKSYPLEMHIVTYSSLFSNILEAISNTRALAVVGVFFELSETPNQNLQPLITALTNVRHKNHHKTLGDDFKLLELVDNRHLKRFYRYDGSLTTPPCYESVIWTVLQEPLNISLAQLQAFRDLHDEKNKTMKITYRPVKELGNRKLYRNFHEKDARDEPKEHTVPSGSIQQYLSMNMIFIFILINFLMNIFSIF